MSGLRGGARPGRPGVVRPRDVEPDSVRAGAAVPEPAPAPPQRQPAARGSQVRHVRQEHAPAVEDHPRWSHAPVLHLRRLAAVPQGVDDRRQRRELVEAFLEATRTAESRTGYGEKDRTTPPSWSRRTDDRASAGGSRMGCSLRPRTRRRTVSRSRRWSPSGCARSDAGRQSRLGRGRDSETYSEVWPTATPEERRTLLTDAGVQVDRPPTDVPGAVRRLRQGSGRRPVRLRTSKWTGSSKASLAWSTSPTRNGSPSRAGDPPTPKAGLNPRGGLGCKLQVSWTAVTCED